MSQYMARAEGTPRRPNTRRSRRENRVAGEKNPPVRLFSRKLKAQDEESPPVSMLPPPSRSQKLKVEEEDIPPDSMLPSPLAAGKRKLVVPGQVQRHPWAKDPEVFADDPPVMDCSDPCNYFQYPDAHRYKEAEEIPLVATWPSPSRYGEPKLMFPDQIEKHPRAKEVCNCNQPVPSLDNLFGPPSERNSITRYREFSRFKDFVASCQTTSGSSAVDDSFASAYQGVYTASYWAPIRAISEPMNTDPKKVSGKGRVVYVKGSREYSEKLARDHQTVMDCLRHYNSNFLGVEYEPAPGKVTSRGCTYDGIQWIHGNFVARRKRHGWFSFLPGPRTLFFFELRFDIKDASREVITCTPLLDEPVTEAYNVLGCPLWWWSTRRSGKYDTICKTCKRRSGKGILACGHKEREALCKMCYLHAGVLHPSAGEFTFGHEECSRFVAC